MRKRDIAFGLGLLMMAFSLPACAKSEKNPAATEGPTAVEATDAADATEKNPGADEDASGKGPGAREDASGNGHGTDAGTSDQGSDELSVQHIPITVEEGSITAYKPDSYTTMAECTYFTLALDEETAKRYPELQKTFAQRTSDNMEHAEGTLAEFSEEYQGIAEYMEESGAYLSENVKPHIMRSDSRIVSILCDADNYNGGAHGYYWTYGLNYDPASGRELQISDVVPEKEKFLALIREKFEEQYVDGEHSDMLTNASDYLASLSEEEYETSPWTMDSERMTLFFAPYVLGTYADGAQEISIYFDEAPELFDAKYLDTCAEYVIPLLSSHTYEVNAGNGKRVPVTVELDYQDTYDSYNMAYVIGNTTIRPDGYCYSWENYIVNVGGKPYLYSFTSVENDYHLLHVVDVETKTLDESRYENLALYRPIYVSEDAKGRFSYRTGGAAFTDPGSVDLECRLEVIGTTNGYQNYHVCSDGYPACASPYYTIDSRYAFRSKKDLVLDTVDEDGAAIGTKAVPAGTCFCIVRTDGKTIADIQTIDASALDIHEEDDWKNYAVKDSGTYHIDFTKPIYRVKVDRSDWPHRVNGVEEESLFDGIVYAG